MLLGLHHIAIIVSDYQRSKRFYLDILGFELRSEHYRADRDSWKADLTLQGQYVLELFSFPHPPVRLSRPEALGLRHLAFSVTDIHAEKSRLEKAGVLVEEIRTDPYTTKLYTFFTDPDGLPIELYQV